MRLVGGIPGGEAARVSDEQGPKLREIPRLIRGFYPVACSHHLRGKPLCVRLWGRSYVLFRDETGTARALPGECPHRNAPLALGRVVEGKLECPYHGWRFDGTGAVCLVPGLSVLERVPPARGFDTREELGFIWMKPSFEKDLYGRLELPLASDRRYATFVREVSAPAYLHAVCENALDVPHTAFLHRGLFRGGERNSIEARLARNESRVEIEYRGEPLPSGLLARLLAVRAGSGTVEHFDRFLLPGIIQVEYRLGDAAHFVITGFCSPVSDQETKLFVVVSYRTRLPARLLALVLEPLARFVFWQDARLLGEITKLQAELGGPKYFSTELDAMGPEIWRLLRHAAGAESSGALTLPHLEERTRTFGFSA